MTRGRCREDCAPGSLSRLSRRRPQRCRRTREPSGGNGRTSQMRPVPPLTKGGGNARCESSPQASGTGGRLAPCASASSLPSTRFAERETRPAATAYSLLRDRRNRESCQTLASDCHVWLRDLEVCHWYVVSLAAGPCYDRDHDPTAG